MLVIEIIAGALALWAVGWAIYAFERFTFNRCQHRFLTVKAFLLASLAIALLYFGDYWWGEARASGGDELNGMILMLGGATTAVGIVAWNVRRAGLVIGSVGSVLQTVLFSTFGWLGILALIVGALVFAIAFAGTGAKPVYVINR